MRIGVLKITPAVGAAIAIVVIGGSVVGGIAFAANGSSQGPPSISDSNGQNEDPNDEASEAPENEASEAPEENNQDEDADHQGEDANNHDEDADENSPEPTSTEENGEEGGSGGEGSGHD